MIDASIPMGVRGFDASVLMDGIGDGLRLRDLAAQAKQRKAEAEYQNQQRNRAATLQGLYSQAVRPGANGAPEIDRQGLLGGLMQGGFGQEALAAQGEFAQQDSIAAEQARKAKAAKEAQKAQWLGGYALKFKYAKDPAQKAALRQRMIAEGQAMGEDMSDTPDEIGDGEIEMLELMALDPETRAKVIQEKQKTQQAQSLAEQAQANKERELAFKDREITGNEKNRAAQLGLEREKLELARQNAALAAQKAATKQVDLPGVMAQAERGLMVLDQMVGQVEKTSDGKIIRKTAPHPGFRASVGAKGASSLFGLKDEPIAGTDAADFRSLYDQITGQAFMEAFQNLRGAGQITEQEGKKASAAITRMNLAQSEADFIRAADEFREVIRKGVETAKQKAQAFPPRPGAPAQPAPTPVTPKSDPLGLF